MAAGVDGFLAGEGLRAGQYMFVCNTLLAGCDRSSGDARLVVEVNTNRSAVRVPEGEVQLDLERYGTRSETRLGRGVKIPFLAQIFFFLGGSNNLVLQRSSSCHEMGSIYLGL